MSFNDKLKQAIDKVDPDRRLAELKGAAGELAREHGGRLDEALGKVEATVDEKTKGKYADKLASARGKSPSRSRGSPSCRRHPSRRSGPRTTRVATTGDTRPPSCRPRTGRRPTACLPES